MVVRRGSIAPVLVCSIGTTGQAVVTVAAPFDLADQFFESAVVTRAIANLVGALPEGDNAGPRVRQHTR